MTKEESKLYSENVVYGTRLAVARALDRHKRLGYPIAIWRDNKVVIIPAEQIVVEYPSQDEKPKELKPCP
jgi:hypothetical protein